MAPIEPVAVTTEIRREKPELSVDLPRVPVSVQIGPVLAGASLPKPDLNDHLTAETGVRARFASNRPTPDAATLARFEVFVQDWIEKNLTPLSPTTDVTLETWLLGTSYPDWRKNELRKAWDACGGNITRKHESLDSFIKDEEYLTWKQARGINARSDEYKCFVGPIFKAIESEVYKNQFFIKHVPVAERPQYIVDNVEVPDSCYLETDHSQFEASFSPEIIQRIELRLYRYMCKYVSGGRTWIESLERVLPGLNVCKFKWFVVRVLGKRMSGEMCTSLGNGFVNLMLMLFTAYERGCSDVRGVVEGDDGLFSMRGDSLPTVEDFLKLGFNIKLAKHVDLNTASFCGLIFDKTDKINVVNPMKFLATFGWASRRYLDSKPKKRSILLRCKALSLAYQYPSCPIICSFAHAILRSTRHVRHFVYSYVKRTGAIAQWKRTRLMLSLADEKDLVNLPPPFATRLLMEKQFGILVEHQIALEAVFQDWDGRGEIPGRELLDPYIKPEWEEYWSDYVVPKGVECLLPPRGPHVRPSDFMSAPQR